MARYLGLDYGSKTIGVAVSSPTNITAIGVTTLSRSIEEAFRPILKDLKAIIRSYEITHIVLGYPKNLDGSEGKRCRQTDIFKEKLEKYFKSITVLLWDERYSTEVIKRTTDPQKKTHIDEMSAVYILQGYLDYINH